MKFRNGFVSNSSSSSFVIAINNGNKPCSHCGRKDPNILDLIPDYETHSDSTHVEAEGIKSTLQAIKEWSWFYEPNDPRYDEKYKKDYKIEKNIWEGRKKIIEEANEEYDQVAVIRLSYHDHETRMLFDQAVKNGSLKIIVGDEE